MDGRYYVAANQADLYTRLMLLPINISRASVPFLYFVALSRR